MHIIMPLSGVRPSAGAARRLAHRPRCASRCVVTSVSRVRVAADALSFVNVDRLTVSIYSVFSLFFFFFLVGSGLDYDACV